MTTNTTETLEWPVSRVRQTFVDFFVARGHTFVPSSAVVPLADPTLLFTNAGMNQFKSIFLGTVDPNTEFGKLRRAANSQLCIRAGGKHNDLEDVGRDTYHHTFFEMLGSWSFGDYFKQEIIAWSWELLTEVYKIPKERLYVTYFEGDAANHLAPDIETKEMWLKFLPADHVLPGNAKDNFWEMGETGPCGPCSEIHYDRIGGGRNAAGLVNHDDPMVVEIWNLVFIQFERQSGGKLVPLPNKHVDTGMGLERLTSILQNVISNYDTDVWLPIFEAIQRVTQCPTPYTAIAEETNNDVTIAYRVVADHIRCLTAALADGAMPDSVGRGFVLRRIIRRAVRYGIQFLNAQPGFFHLLVDSVVASLGDFFPHLREPRTVQRIKAILADEESSFARTWETGLRHFTRAAEEARRRGDKMVSGAEAFILHDRYGFPVDLTCLLAEKAQMSVDLDGFNAEMKANQVSAGRVAAAKTFLDVHQLDELKRRGVPQTDDEAKYSLSVPLSSTVLAIYDKSANAFVELLTPNNSAGDEGVALILDRTNFYAESGGQIYDTGRICAAVDVGFIVRKCYNLGGYVVHIGNFDPHCAAAPLPCGASVEPQVDAARRLAIAANHTTTHELNWVLRQVLQEERPEAFMDIQQKGSLVTEELLRFDFSYNAKLTVDELRRVEAMLNAQIQADVPVHRATVPLDAAMQINGVRQMFGEKYPDPVCVLCVGDADVTEMLAEPNKAEWRRYAVEFCGGTHLTHLGLAERAVILSEEALMKGVRRIVVVTRAAASQALACGAELEAELSALLEAPLSAATVKALSVLNKKVGDSAAPLLQKHALREQIDTTIKKMNAQLKTLAAEAKEKAQSAGKELGAQHNSATTPFLVLRLDEYGGPEREPLQAFADGFTAAVSGPVGLFIVGSDAEKALAVVTMPEAFVQKKLSAVNWAKAAIGKGGGKPNAAQSGFAASELDAVLAAANAEVDVMKRSLQ